MSPRREMMLPKTMRLAVALLLSLGALTASFGVGEARLAVRPPSKPTPTPVHTPPATPSPAQPTPTAAPNGPVGDAALCRSSLKNGFQAVATTAARAFATCAQRGFDCLATSSASLCCARVVGGCRDELAELERVRGTFRLRLSEGRCALVSYDDLARESGFDLGSIGTACSRLSPIGAPFDRDGLADCLDRLITEDVYHRVTTFDVPRADEAFECLGLDAEELPAIVAVDPASCEPPPPTPTPVVPPSPTPPGPTPTPSPGPEGCQPALGGPCDDGTFTHCCNENQHCAPAFVSPAVSNFCFAGAPSPTPAPTATPDGSATPDPSPTPTAASSTPTPVAPTPTPSGPTPTPSGPTPTPGGPTPTPGGPTPSPTPAGCTTATVVITTSFSASDATGVTVNLEYPGPKLGIAPSQLLSRVLNRTGVSGIFQAADNDVVAPGDGFNDRLSPGLVSIPGPIPAGPFAEATFDCRAGAALPEASEFACVADVADLLGQTIPATCSISLVTAP